MRGLKAGGKAPEMYLLLMFETLLSLHLVISNIVKYCVAGYHLMDPTLKVFEARTYLIQYWYGNEMIFEKMLKVSKASMRSKELSKNANEENCRNLAF